SLVVGCWSLALLSKANGGEVFPYSAIPSAVIPSAVRTNVASEDKSRLRRLAGVSVAGARSRNPERSEGALWVLICHPERRRNERSELRQVEGPWVSFLISSEQTGLGHNQDVSQNFRGLRSALSRTRGKAARNASL